MSSVTEPQVNQIQVEAQTTTSNTRGRGSFRGRSRGRVDTQARRAQAQINRNAPPVQLDGKFLGFHSLNRGNAKVQLNQGVTENVGNDYSNTIRAVQSGKGLYDQNGQPLDHEYLTRGLNAGLCISLALKLIQATPNSQVPSIANVHSFRHFTVHVPRSFIQLVDLVGKTDYQDWVIRIQDNHDLIQRLLLKALKYCKQNDDFIAEYVHMDQASRQRFDGLDGVRYDQFDNIYFATTSSVKRIKERALKWLKIRLRENFQVDMNGNQITFGYPQLPSDSPTPAEVANWLGLFVPNVHPDYQNIILTGCLLLLETNWLRTPNEQLQNLNDAFANTPVAQNSPIQILNACGLHHLNEYLSDQSYIELSRSVFEYYEQTITQRLRSIFVMVQQGVSTLGSPAQLIFIPHDMLRERQTNGLNRADLDSNVNHCISYVKLSVSHDVIKSAMIGLVKDVELDPDYEGHFAGALISIRRSFLSGDGLIYAHDRQRN